MLLVHVVGRNNGRVSLPPEITPFRITLYIDPDLSVSLITPKPLGVALDTLTISPFLVIDEKLVEVFNGDKSM